MHVFSMAAAAAARRLRNHQQTAPTTTWIRREQVPPIPCPRTTNRTRTMSVIKKQAGRTEPGPGTMKTTTRRHLIRKKKMMVHMATTTTTTRTPQTTNTRCVSCCNVYTRALIAFMAPSGARLLQCVHACTHCIHGSLWRASVAMCTRVHVTVFMAHSGARLVQCIHAHVAAFMAHSGARLLQCVHACTHCIHGSLLRASVAMLYTRTLLLSNRHVPSLAGEAVAR